VGEAARACRFPAQHLDGKDRFAGSRLGQFRGPEGAAGGPAGEQRQAEVPRGQTGDKKFVSFFRGRVTSHRLHEKREGSQTKAGERNKIC